MNRAKEIAAVFLLAAALTIAAGCGSGSSATGASSAASRPAAAGSSGEFTEKGGNNGPATFGKAAGREQMEAAATVLEENLKARAKANFTEQCATLSASAAEKVEADAPNFGAAKGCANGLRAEAQPLAQTKAVRADTLIDGVAVLRVKGKFGYALYHGPKGKDYAMLMEKKAAPGKSRAWRREKSRDQSGRGAVVRCVCGRPLELRLGAQRMWRGFQLIDRWNRGRGKIAGVDRLEWLPFENLRSKRGIPRQGPERRARIGWQGIDRLRTPGCFGRP